MSWPSVPDRPALIPSDQNFYDTEEWYRVFEETCLDPGDLPRIERLDGGHVLPLRERPDAIGPIRGRRPSNDLNFSCCSGVSSATNFS